MSTAPPAAATPKSSYKLGVNAYDRGSSLLISLLVIIGVFVSALVIIWYTSRQFRQVPPIAVQPVDPASRPMDAAMGFQRDIEPPGIEDAPELTEPQLQDTLTALAAVASKTALLSDEEIDAEREAGRGTGMGDSRAAGAGGEGDPVKEPQREIRFEPASTDEYAQWLDYYNVELAVLGRDNKVYYASGFTQAQPDVRVGEPTEEKRLYFNSEGTPLAPLDRRLAERAGIAGRGRYILQFFPNEAAGRLLGLEQQAADGRTMDQIQRTVFRVTREGGQFQFSVEEQVYY